MFAIRSCMQAKLLSAAGRAWGMNTMRDMTPPRGWMLTWTTGGRPVVVHTAIGRGVAW